MKIPAYKNVSSFILLTLFTTASLASSYADKPQPVSNDKIHSLDGVPAAIFARMDQNANANVDTLNALNARTGAQSTIVSNGVSSAGFNSAPNNSTPKNSIVAAQSVTTTANTAAPTSGNQISAANGITTPPIILPITAITPIPIVLPPIHITPPNPVDPDDFWWIEIGPVLITFPDPIIIDIPNLINIVIIPPPPPVIVPPTPPNPFEV